MTPLLLLALLTAQAPDPEKDKRDPSLVVVGIDDMRVAGTKIAMAQQLTNATVYAMKQRVGDDGVVYEGVLAGHKKMVRMVGDTPDGARKRLIDYYEAGLAAAKYRVKVTFGKKRKKHFVLLQCRKGDGTISSKKKKGKRAKMAKPLEEKRIEGKDFGIALAGTKEALKTFCSALAPLPTPETAPPAKKKADKAWSPPPRR